MLPISLEPIPISQSEELVEEKKEDNQIFDQFQFDQVYERRKDPMATTRQEQSTEPSLGNEVTILEHKSTTILDHGLPIALRKETRECTKRPLYPLSHFVFLKIFLELEKLPFNFKHYSYSQLIV